MKKLVSRIREFLRNIVQLNGALSKKSMASVAILEVLLFMLLWQTAAPTIFVKPSEMFPAIQDLLREGLLGHLIISLVTLLEALIITSAFTFALAISTAIPFMRPGVKFATTMRFVSFTGFTLLFTLITGGGHWLKVSMLVFGMGTYMLTSMNAIVSEIPRAQYAHARTLGLSELQVTWEVMILGQRHKFIEAIRQNAAIGWMLVPVVEKLMMSEGGFGYLLFIEERHFNLAEIFSIQVFVFVLAMIQDFGFGKSKDIISPYAKLTLGGHQ